MAQNKVRSLAAAGGLVVTVATLAGCGGGSPGGHAAGRVGSTATGPTVTTTGPTVTTTGPTVTTTGPTVTTTVPGPTTTVPAATAPTAVATPATVAPPATVPPPASTKPATASPASAPAAPSTTAGTGAGSAEPVLLVRSYDGSLAYDGREPSTIGFSGDSTNIVTHLTWTSWGPHGAVGHGSLGVNNCEPNCAQGTLTEVPATVELDTVVNGHFTAMTEKAGTITGSYDYPAKWATSAS